jgi:hypothetical protein
MLSRLLAIPAISAQALDLFSMHWATEINPIVLALGPLSFVLKAAVVVGCGVMAVYLPSRKTAVVLTLALVTGTLGALSNGVL